MVLVVAVKYKLYFHDRFTGKKILRQEFDTIDELRKAWVDRTNSEYLLTATKEVEITNLPKRPRAKSEFIF